MFKKKKSQLPPVWLLRLEQLDRSLWNLNREVDDLRQSISNKRLAQADAREMNALTAMVGELARRIDLANIADLPEQCKCEACGCNNLMVAVPKAIAPSTKGYIHEKKYIDGDNIDAYCVKCKDKRWIANMKITTSDSGRRMAQGNCDVCGTKVNRILGKA